MADHLKSIGERLWDAEARLGVIILLDAAHDGESACDALDAFIEDDIGEKSTLQDLARDWPELPQLLSVNRPEEDDDWALRATVLDLFQSQCPKRFLVRVEHTIKSVVLRKPEQKYPCSTWASGWGFFMMRWCLVDSLDEAVERAIEYAELQRREAWDNSDAAVREGVANG